MVSTCFPDISLSVFCGLSPTYESINVGKYHVKMTLMFVMAKIFQMSNLENNPIKMIQLIRIYIVYICIGTTGVIHNQGHMVKTRHKSRYFPINQDVRFMF